MLILKFTNHLTLYRIVHACKIFQFLEINYDDNKFQFIYILKIVIYIILLFSFYLVYSSYIFSEINSIL